MAFAKCLSFLGHFSRVPFRVALATPEPKGFLLLYMTNPRPHPQHLPVIIAMQRGPMVGVGHRDGRWRRRNDAVRRRRRRGQRRRQRRRLTLHVLARVLVVDERMRVGRLAAQQMDEGAPERAILPRIDDRVHAGIGHGQRESGLVVVGRAVGGELEDSRTRHDEIRQPADGEAAQYQNNDLHHSEMGEGTGVGA